MSAADEAEEPLCHCRSVYRDQVRHAIREQGARSVDDLQELTTACTGCGCCRWDLEDFIAATLSEDRAATDG